MLKEFIMNYDKNKQLIDITIIIGNTRDHRKIISGKSYYLTLQRDTLIKDLLREFYKNFEGELLIEIQQYSLFTKKMIRLKDDNMIKDVFSILEDSDLNIYDKDETIFYLVLI